MESNNHEKLMMELLENISYIKAKVEVIDKIEEDVENIQREVTSIKVEQAKDISMTKENQRRIGRLEDINKWIARTTGGVIISAIVGFFINFK